MITGHACGNDDVPWNGRQGEMESPFKERRPSCLIFSGACGAEVKPPKASHERLGIEREASGGAATPAHC